MPDAGIRIFAILGYAAPPFFVGLLAQLLLQPAPRLAAGVEDGVGAWCRRTAVEHTHILIVDLAIEGDWEGVWDVSGT